MLFGPAMTSVILENADLNRLFPKCRPRAAQSSGCSTQGLPHEQHKQQAQEGSSATTADMIDLERDSVAADR